MLAGCSYCLASAAQIEPEGADFSHLISPKVLSTIQHLAPWPKSEIVFPGDSMSTGELAGSAGLKLAQQQIDKLLQEQGVEPQTRENILALSSMMYEYIPYAIAQRKDPTNGRVLAEFLAKKGMNTSKLFGNESLNCGIAMVEFVLGAKETYAATLSGFPPAVALAWGLSVIDLIEVGNSCDFIQQAYYEAFLRESSVKIKRVRSETQQLICLEPNGSEAATNMSQMP